LTDGEQKFERWAGTDEVQYLLHVPEYLPVALLVFDCIDPMQHLNLRKFIVLEIDQTAYSRFRLPCICHTAIKTVDLAQEYGRHQERKGLIPYSKCVVKDIIHIK
jgi:hypothetical protein